MVIESNILVGDIMDFNKFDWSKIEETLEETSYVLLDWN